MQLWSIIRSASFRFLIALHRPLRAFLRTSHHFTRQMNPLRPLSQRVVRRRVSSRMEGQGTAPSEYEGAFESFPLFEEDWFTEKVFEYLDSYDLLDCSLVNRRFMQASRKHMHGYKLLSSEALSCLSERLALADSLELYFGDVILDLLSFRDLPTFRNLTSLNLDSKESSLGFNYSRLSEVTQLKHLQVWSLKDNSNECLTSGLWALKNLRSLRIAQTCVVSMADLSASSRLRKLELENCTVNADYFWMISKLVNLESLTFVYPDNLSFDSTFPYLAQLGRLKELKITNLGCNKKFLKEVVLRLPELMSLYLTVIEWGEQVLDFSVLSELPKLQELTISFEFDVANLSMIRLSEISTLQKFRAVMTKNSAKCALPHLQDLPVFKELLCDDLSSRQQDQFFPDVAELTQLVRLELTKTTPQAIGAVGLLTNLESLVLTESTTTPANQWTAFSRLVKLKHLEIEGAGLALASVCSSVRNFNELEDLSIKRTAALKGAQFECLGQLADLNKLTSLKMSVSVEDQAEVLFNKLANLAHLRKLEIRFLLPLHDMGDKVSALESLKGLRWLSITSEVLSKQKEQSLMNSLPLLRRITRL